MTVNRAGLYFALVLVSALTAFVPAHAGGVNFGDDNDNNIDQGPYFFGFVRDDTGSSVPDAKVTATVKAGGALVTRTNGMGVYKFRASAKTSTPTASTFPAPRTATSKTPCCAARMPPATMPTRSRSSAR